MIFTVYHIKKSKENILNKQKYHSFTLCLVEEHRGVNIGLLVRKSLVYVDF